MVIGSGDAGGGEQRGELEGMSTVRFWPSQATFGRVTAAAGLAGMRPSMTAYL